MKLVASMIVAEVETRRYLVPCVDHLLDFCDEVVMLFDGEDHAWVEDLVGVWGESGMRVIGVRRSGVDFFQHEGQARQALLDATLERHPTHVLAIDADEFVADGEQLRLACADERWDAWALCMQEVWNTAPAGLEVRQDGGWVEHDVAALWNVERLQRYDLRLSIADRALACGRIPTVAQRAAVGHTCTGILHFGWAKKDERQARYDRYAVHDGGRYHASSHLQSILLPDESIRLTTAPWPEWDTELVDAVLSVAS